MEWTKFIGSIQSNRSHSLNQAFEWTALFKLGVIWLISLCKACASVSFALLGRWPLVQSLLEFQWNHKVQPKRLGQLQPGGVQISLFHILLAEVFGVAFTDTMLISCHFSCHFLSHDWGLGLSVTAAWVSQLVSLFPAFAFAPVQSTNRLWCLLLVQTPNNEDFPEGSFKMPKNMDGAPPGVVYLTHKVQKRHNHGTNGGMSDFPADTGLWWQRGWQSSWSWSGRGWIVSAFAGSFGKNLKNGDAMLQWMFMKCGESLMNPWLLMRNGDESMMARDDLVMNLWWFVNSSNGDKSMMTCDNIVMF